MPAMFLAMEYYACYVFAMFRNAGGPDLPLPKKESAISWRHIPAPAGVAAPRSRKFYMRARIV